MSLAQRIKEAEKQLLDKQDALKALHESKGDGSYSDADMETISKANSEIAHERENARRSQRERAHYGGVERRRSRSLDHLAQYGTARTEIPRSSNRARPFNIAAKKIASARSPGPRRHAPAIRAQPSAKPVEEVRRAIYGDDESNAKRVRRLGRSAPQAPPAMTTVTGWAAELVQQIVVDFMQTLLPKSVYPRALAATGSTLSFGRNGKIIIPTRSRTPTIAGSFVGEGQPIPVRQGAFTSQTLTPKKMAVITTWTREIDEHSVPAIEGLLRTRSEGYGDLAR